MSEITWSAEEPGDPDLARAFAALAAATASAVAALAALTAAAAALVARQDPA